MSRPPDDLRELERLLQAVHFEPRASLGAEVMGRWRRGEVAREGPAVALRRILGLLGVAGLLAVGGSGFWLLAWQPLHRITVDRCCQDLDGGGDADDGLLVVSQHGSRIHYLKIYEDRDHSGSYSPGDPVRFVRRGSPVLSGPLEPGVRTVEFCCLDYDGGGPSDDALLVVGLPPDRITMAAIYERPPGGPPAPLR